MKEFDKRITFKTGDYLWFFKKPWMWLFKILDHLSYCPFAPKYKAKQSLIQGIYRKFQKLKSKPKL